MLLKWNTVCVAFVMYPILIPLLAMINFKFLALHINLETYVRKLILNLSVVQCRSKTPRGGLAHSPPRWPQHFHQAHPDQGPSWLWTPRYNRAWETTSFGKFINTIKQTVCNLKCSNNVVIISIHLNKT